MAVICFTSPLAGEVAARTRGGVAISTAPVATPSPQRGREQAHFRGAIRPYFFSAAARTFTGSFTFGSVSITTLTSLPSTFSTLRT